MAVVTFGYTSAGVSTFLSATATYIVGNTYTSGANAGTLNKITAFLNKTGTPTGKRVKAAIYSGTTLLGASSDILQTDLSTTITAVDFTFSGETILAATDYTLVLMIEPRIDGSNLMTFYRDASGVNSVSATVTYGSFPSPATWTAGTRKYSIYATYTEGGGASAAPVIMRSHRQRRV